MDEKKSGEAIAQEAEELVRQFRALIAAARFLPVNEQAEVLSGLEDMAIELREAVEAARQ